MTLDGDDAATAWVGAALASYGEELTGAWERPHTRFWSTATRYGTTAGRVWLKVNGAGTRPEGALTELLGRHVPDLVPEVLAVDRARGWWLSRDAGPTLRRVATPEESWPLWEALVVRYAQAQLDLAPRREEVLAAGVREASPVTLPEQARALIEELAARPADEGGTSRDETDLLLRELPALEEWCAELAASDVPCSVQHDDLHSANVCWPGPVDPGGAATARIVDWGDACWGFPLATMLGTSRSLAFHAGTTTGARRVLRVRDAYLEPFTRSAGGPDRSTLVRLTDLAARVGCVGKALAWQAATTGAPTALLREEEFPVREWLLELLSGR